MKLTEAVKWLWSDDTLSARRARWVLKIVLVLLLLIALFWVVDFREVIHALATADPLFLIIGFALTFLRVFLSAVQLMILVRKQGINLGVGQIIYINLSVKFYLLFLPGDLVGSGIRWYKLSQPSGKRAEALAAVAFNRLFDLFLIFVLGLGFWLLSSQDYVQIDGRQLVVLILLIILLWFILTRLSLPLSKIIASRAGGTYSPSFFQVGMQKLEKFLLAIANYADFSAWQLLFVTFVGISRQLVGIGSFVFLAKAVGIEMSFIDMGWIRSIVLLAAFLPFSFAGGLGVREITLVVVLSTFDVSAELAIAFSLLLLARGFLLGLAGGLLEAIHSLRVKHVA